MLSYEQQTQSGVARPVLVRPVWPSARVNEGNPPRHTSNIRLTVSILRSENRLSMYPSKHITLAGRETTLLGLSDDDPYFSSIFDGFEQGFHTLLVDHLSPYAVALDVGANTGVTSLILSRYLSDGRVFAFEPSPTVFKNLETNLSNNEALNVTPIRQAVGSGQGPLEFVDMSANGHIVQPESMEDTANIVAVDVITLDQFVKDNSIDRIHFLEIDPEGFEHDVFLGMTGIEEVFRPLVYFEFNSWCLIAFNNENPRDFLNHIHSRFSAVFYFDEAGSPLRLTKHNTMDFLHRNLVYHGCVDNLLATNDPARFGLD